MGLYRDIRPGRTNKPVSGIAVAPNGDIWLAGHWTTSTVLHEGVTWDSTGISARQGWHCGIAVAPNPDIWLATPDDITFLTTGQRGTLAQRDKLVIQA